MKNVIKFLSYLLSIVMIVCVIPHSVLVQIGEALSQTDTLNANDTTSSQTAQEAENSLYVIGEVEENRTATSKTFRMSDGSYVVADYGKHVHYMSEADKWEDYDNTLSFSSAVTADAEDFSGYDTKSSDVGIKLANNSNSSNLVKITKDNYKISINLSGANKAKSLKVYETAEKPFGDDVETVSTLNKFSSCAVYENILPSTDLEYIISGSTLKENIIIKEKNGVYQYTFELKLKGLVPVLSEDGSVAINDEKSGKTVFVIPKGFMYDAEGNVSQNVTYTVESQNGNKYNLVVTPDRDWIESDDRTFPVTIDPTVEAFKTTLTTYDTYINQSAPNLNEYLRAEILAGYCGTDTSKECHALLRPASLPVLPDSAVVTNAKMCVAHMYNGTEYTKVTIGAVRIESAWESETATWNNRPVYDPDGEIYDYFTVDVSSEGSYFGFDITRAVQGWYSGAYENYGIALVPIEGNGVGRIYFGSSDYLEDTRPKLLVSYFDTKGIEGIWTYSSHNVGNAGTGYVNGFNGNLVYVHDDMATEGSVLPVVVSHVYNNYLSGKEFNNSEDVNSPVTADFSNMLVGKGFKLSVQETVAETTVGDEDYIVYNDADGTELYFYKEVKDEKTEFISELGYPLTVTESGSGWILSDEYGNKKTFDSLGRLVEITDVNGNSKTFYYESNQLKTIKYSYKVENGQSTPVEQLTFTYNSNNALKKITNAYDPSDYVEFYYSTTYNGAYSTGSSGFLRKISYSKGGYSLYNYNSAGKLLSTSDGDTGYKVSYGYANGKVMSVTESANSVSGQTVIYSYGDNLFTVRASGKDDSIYSSDDILTTYLFDNYGRAFCAYSSNTNNTEIYGTSYIEYNDFEKGAKTNNKIKTDSVKGLTRENLLNNGSAEQTASWSFSKNGNGSGSYTQEEAYYGARSLKLTATSTTDAATYRNTLNITSTGKYTLSAYVKTEDLQGSGGFELILGSTKSEVVKTTPAEIENGWQRISVTADITSTGTRYAYLKLSGASGTVYVDCVQVEKGETPSDYNFIQNSGMSSSAKWSGSFSTQTESGSHAGVGKLVGDPFSEKTASQTVELNCPTDKTFMLTGWAKAASADLVEAAEVDETDEYDHDVHKLNRKFGLRAVITYSDSTEEEHYISFNEDNVNWQYVSLAVVPEKSGEGLTVSSITVKAVYDHNANEMLFDDICLTVEPAQTYVYDEDGNLKTATDALGNDSMLDYVEDRSEIEKFTSVTGEVYEYTYSEENEHQLDKVTKTSGDVSQKLTYDYDSFGNVKSTVLSASVGGTEMTETITSSATYSADGNYLLETIDSLGNATGYTYAETTKLLQHITDVKGNQTAYEYDSRQRVKTVYLDKDNDGVVDTTDPAVNYLYANNRLSNITTASSVYTLTYDSFGNLVSVKAGDNTLATYTYASGNGKLLRLDYGNGDFETYEYDNLDRLVKVYYNGSAEAKYALLYDANGQLYSLTEGSVIHIYDYDSLGRLVRARQKNINGLTVLSVYNAYDEIGRVKGTVYDISGVIQEYGITYKEQSNLVATYTTANGVTNRYTYDVFERLSNKVYNKHSVTYTYINGSALVSNLTVSCENGTVLNYGYTYDKLGNITKITENGTVVAEYEYDALSQLICEEYPVIGDAFVYTYDKSGNILSKLKFPYNANASIAQYLTYLAQYKETIGDYTYSSSEWGDLLVNYNGTSISYDEIGNPNNWHNASSLTWNKRELSSLVLNDESTLSFAYNSNGIRKQKYYSNSNNSVTHLYTLDGTVILKEVIHTFSASSATSDILYYYYDETGVVGFEHNGTDYYFIKNLQGDIVSIYNNSGAVVVNYTYDAWGKVLSVTGSLADTVGQLNPFRYRGYYYDNETGFYYLNSRYYDPSVGRFLNADGIIGANGGVVGYNIFSYCNNNPVISIDIDGQDALVLTRDGLVGHLGIIVQDSDGRWHHFYWGADNGNSSSSSSGSFMPWGTEAKTWCVEYDGEIDLDAINDSGDYDYEYERMTRLYGDFSSCIDKMYNASGEYNLYTNNCVQKSLSILMTANTEYNDALDKAIQKWRPEKAHDALIENMPDIKPSATSGDGSGVGAAILLFFGFYKIFSGIYERFW